MRVVHKLVWAAAAVSVATAVGTLVAACSASDSGSSSQSTEPGADEPGSPSSPSDAATSDKPGAVDASGDGHGGGPGGRGVRIFGRARELFTGFDGVHSFVVPVVARGPKDTPVTWSISDESKASLASIPYKPPAGGPMAGDGGGGGPGGGAVSAVAVTTKAAGTVRVTATAGDKSDSIQITVQPYTKEQYDLGAARYTKGGSGPSCVTCHFADGGVDHSPFYTAQWPDEGVVGIFTTGKRPDGSKLRTPSHAFTTTEAEKTGLVAYLRSLALPLPADDGS